MKKVIVSLCLMMVTVCLCCTMVFAHSAQVSELEGTTIQFGFSDGSVMAGIKVLVYDAEGETVATGKTTKDGTFDYAEYIGTAVEVMGNDGEGHMVTYDIPADAADRVVTEEVPTEEAPAEDTPVEEVASTNALSASKIAGIAIIVVGLAAAGVVVMKKRKK